MSSRHIWKAENHNARSPIVTEKSLSFLKASFSCLFSIILHVHLSLNVTESVASQMVLVLKLEAIRKGVVLVDSKEFNHLKEVVCFLRIRRI